MSLSISSVFEECGALAGIIPAFAARPQQQIAAKAVADLLAGKSRIALIEAGTGVGKTLAYLAPAILAADPGLRIVISTHTLALQSQLAEKDLPMVRRLSERPLETAVVKGRNNYLCLQDYEAAKSDLLTVGDIRFSAIGEWLRTTTTGDAAELGFTYAGWPDIRADADTCKASDCRFFDRCFYYRMRREAGGAALILVNHAVFFADLAIRRAGKSEMGLLPDYDIVIFDEAHHVEAVAAGAFGVTFSTARLQQLVDRLRRTSPRLAVDQSRLSAIEVAAEELFAPFLHFGRPEFFLSEAVGSDQDLQDARIRVRRICDLLDGLRDDLSRIAAEQDPAIQDRQDGLRAQCARSRDDLQTLFCADDPDYIRWGSLMRLARRAPAATLNWTPISVGRLLEETLWDRDEPLRAVLMSATLATNGAFEFMRRRLGIARPAVGASGFRSARITETIVGSPFDYEQNCLLYVPSAMPAPSEDPGYLFALAEQLQELVDASAGGAFLLFTSHRVLNWVYDRFAFAGCEYVLLRQGDMPNARLGEAFRSTPNAVLFGTQSFWEGVDMPGDVLRLVAIDRIPFTAPDSPLYRARVAEIEEAGGDWFTEYALPQAQLRLKQGFGRLIRSSADRGVVALMDTRLIHRGYGRALMEHLPPARRTASLIDVRLFFHSMGREA